MHKSSSIMAENVGLTYTDEEVDSVLSALPLLNDLNIAQIIAQSEDWDALAELKKNQIKIILLWVIMTEYLQANASATGITGN